MKSLQELYVDSDGFVALRAVLQAFLEKMALDRVFGGEDVVGLADAKDIIDSAFEELDEQFGPKEKPPVVQTSSR